MGVQQSAGHPLISCLVSSSLFPLFFRSSLSTLVRTLNRLVLMVTCRSRSFFVFHYTQRRRAPFAILNTNN